MDRDRDRDSIIKAIQYEMDQEYFSDDDLDEKKLFEELQIFKNPDKLEDIYLKKVDDVNDNPNISDFYVTMGVEYLGWLIPGVVNIIKTTPNQGREALKILDDYLNALKNNKNFDAISNIYREAVKRIQYIDPFFDPAAQGRKSRKKTRRSQRKGKTQKKSRRSQRSRGQSRRRRSSKK